VLPVHRGRLGLADAAVQDGLRTLRGNTARLLGLHDQALADKV
jgi:hypothetical protein